MKSRMSIHLSVSVEWVLWLQGRCCYHQIFCLPFSLIRIWRLHNHQIKDELNSDEDRLILSGEEFLDVMQKAGYEENEKSLRDMLLRASSQSAAGAAVQYSKMSVVARREN